jgi:hypothetical protein
MKLNELWHDFTTWYRYSDLAVWTPILAITAVVVLVVYWAAVLVVSHQCNAHQEATGIPSKVVAGTCYVLVDEQWVHWDRYTRSGK